MLGTQAATPPLEAARHMPGQIRDCNRPLLCAMVKDGGLPKPKVKLGHSQVRFLPRFLPVYVGIAEMPLQTEPRTIGVGLTRLSTSASDPLLIWLTGLFFASLFTWLINTRFGLVICCLRFTTGQEGIPRAYPLDCLGICVSTYSQP